MMKCRNNSSLRYFAPLRLCVNRLLVSHAKAQGPQRTFAKKKDTRTRSTISLCVLLLCVLGAEPSFAQPQPQAQAANERHRYDIQLTLNFDKRTYTGTERLHFVNRGTRPTSTLYFHLYSNLRVPGYLPPKKLESGEA